MNIVLVLVVLYNVLVIGGIGLYLSQRDNASGQVTDMATGGRNANLAMFSVTMAITYLGSAHVYGLMEMSFVMGAVALWFSFAHTILMCVICLGTGQWVRRLGCATIPELIGRIYGKQMRTITACISAMVVFGLVTLETQTLGIGISAISGWALGWAAVVGAILGTAYVTIGGIKQTMWVNLVNAIVMYASIIIAGIYLAFVLPEGWEGVRQHYVTNGQDYKLSIFGTPDLLVGFSLAAVFSVVFAQSVNQQGMAAAMSAKDESVIKRSLWIAAPANGLFGVFPVLCGLAAATIPEFAALGPKLAGATLDIVGANTKGGLTPEQEMRLIRRVIIIVGSLSAALTFYNHPNVIRAITWLFAWLAPLFFIIVAGLFWKRSTKVAFVVVICSWLINCVWSIGPIKQFAVSIVPGTAVLENAHITAITAFVLTVALYTFAKNTKPALFSDAYLQEQPSGGLA